jgi:tape measure domain-containing protein
VAVAENKATITIQADARQALDSLKNVEARLTSLSTGLQKVGHYGAGLLVAVPSLQAMATSAIASADAMTNMASRLRLVTGSAQAAAQVQGQLFDIAQQSRVSFTELGSTYAQIARSATALGIPQERVLNVTRSIGQAMALSGGAAASLQAALVQLSQGMSSGLLRGEELNSILEQAPRLAQALADGLGVPIGRLRAMGEAGELTASQVIAALEKAGPQLQRELGQATLTVSQAMTQLGNATTKLVGDVDAATGASGALAGAISSLAGSVGGLGDAVRRNQGAVDVLLSAGAGVAITAAAAATLRLVASYGSLAAILARIGALVSGPVGIVIGVGTAVGGAVGVVQARRAELESLQGKIEELAKLEDMQRNQPAGLAPRWQARIDQLRADITRMRADVEADFRRGEKDTSPYAGVFPDAKSVAEMEKVAKIDLDVRRKYARDALEIARAYAQEISKTTDPAEQQRLRDELGQRQRALADGLQKSLEGMQPKGGARPKREDAPSPTEILRNAPVTFTRFERGQQDAVEKAAREAETAAYLDDIERRRRAEEDRKRTLEQLTSQTVIGRTQALQRQLALLNEEFTARGETDSGGALGQAIVQVEQQLRDLEPAARQAETSLSTFAEQAARNIQDALGNTLEQMLAGNFDSIDKMWANLMRRLVAQAAATRLNEALFGKEGKGGGWLDLAVSAVGAYFGNYNGSSGINGGSYVPGRPRGGAATGTNVLQRDMITLVHKGEAIVPKAFNPWAGGRGMGGGVRLGDVRINIDSRTDQAEVMRLVSMGVMQGQRAMFEQLRLEGVRA